MSVARAILMFVPQFRPIVGGAERQAEKLARALVRKGTRVTVLTPRIAADSLAYEEDSGVAIHRFPVFDLCKRIPRARGLGLLNLLLIRAQVLRAMHRHLQGVDVVHTHIASPMTAFAMHAAKRWRVPVLCKVAMSGDKTDLRELAAIGLGGRQLGHSMVRNLDRWVATTQAVADSLGTWHVPPERITCIPNGVDLPALNNYSRKVGEARRFLYLGRLSSNIQRDVPAMIRAFDRIATRSAEVELAIVGDGDLYQETADVVSQCPSRDRIQMPGQQEPESWLRWADCLVLPSRREGLSNALLEAMAHGLPCIANDIPSNREVLADGAAGVLVPVGDEGRLLEAMERMAHDAVHADATAAASFSRVRAHYGIESVAARYIALYEDLIRNAIK